MARAEIYTDRDQTTTTLPELTVTATSTPLWGIVILDDGETYLRIRFTQEEAKAVAAKITPHIP